MKLVLEANESSAIWKLPLTLRRKLAPLLDWPEFGEDRRGKHWEAKSNALGPRVYQVTCKLEKGKTMCTLAEAASRLGWGPDELEADLTKLTRGAWRKGNPSVSALVDNDEVTVTRMDKP